MRYIAFVCFFVMFVSARAFSVYNNGPITDGFSGVGFPISRMFPPAIYIGANGQLGFNVWLADNFTVTGDGWHVKRISVYSFQNDQPVFTFTVANVMITTGVDPNLGSTVLDLGGQPVANGGFIGFRVLSQSPNATNRPIYRVDIPVPYSYLPPGNYMLKWSMGSSIVSGPLFAPVAPFAAGNAFQSRLGGAFEAMIDPGLNQQMEFPFQIEYSPAIKGSLYAVDSTRAMYDIDMETGSRTHIGTVSANVNTPAGLAFDPLTRAVYLSDTANDALYTLNLATGSAALVGPFGGGDLLMHGLEWDDRNRFLFGESSHNNGLYRISTTTGAATLIGTSGLTSFQNLGFDLRNNVLYGTNAGTGSLYIMSRATGAASLVGPLNGPSFSSGLAYDWIGDRLFLIDNLSDTLYTVDRTTGQATLVGSTGPGNLLGLVFIGPARVAGRVTLGNWGGAVAGRPVTIELWSGTTLVDGRSTTLDQLGRYTMPTTAPPGTYTVYCKASHWLRRVQTNVTLNAAAALNVDFTLVNGDVDGDNEVQIGDYSKLSSAFGKSLGDPGYDPEADLDGDEEVTIGDYAILSANFGQEGD